MPPTYIACDKGSRRGNGWHNVANHDFDLVALLLWNGKHTGSQIGRRSHKVNVVVPVQAQRPTCHTCLPYTSPLHLLIVNTLPVMVLLKVLRV